MYFYIGMGVCFTAALISGGGLFGDCAFNPDCEIKNAKGPNVFIVPTVLFAVAAIGTQNSYSKKKSCLPKISTTTTTK